MVTWTLSPGFGGLSAGNAESGRTPSVLNPISRMMESAVRAITVPSRPWVPVSFFWERLFSYSEKMFLNDSTGSAGGVDSEAVGWDGFGSGELESEVIGLDMKRVKPLRRDLG